MYNPFSYGSPVTGDRFTGRELELDALLGRMRSGINVVVTGPRRYGKTSLILEAVRRLEQRSPKAAVVVVNLMRCPTLGVFAERLVAGAHRASGLRLRRGARLVPDLVNRLRVQPSVSFDTSGAPSFSFTPMLHERDALTVVDDIYALLAGATPARPAVLVLDEFQAVGDLGGGIAPALKALADEHSSVSLVVAGSRQHLMDALITARGAPLYNMAERIALNPIDSASMARYLEERALAGGKPMVADGTRDLLVRAGLVPNDIQRLAYQAFEEADSTVDAAVVDRAFEAILHLEEASYLERLAGLQRGQRAVLVGIARSGRLEQPYTAEFARQSDYAGPPGVRRAVTALLDQELLTNRNGALAVTDPFFAQWLQAL